MTVPAPGGELREDPCGNRDDDPRVASVTGDSLTDSGPLTETADSAAATALRLAAADVASAQLAFAVGPDGVTEVLWANSALLALTYTDQDEVVGRPIPSSGPQFRGEIPADALPDWWAIVHSSLRGDDLIGDADEPEWHSAMVRLPDRSEVEVQVRITTVEGTGFVVSLRRVSDAVRRAEEAQRESEHRFKALAQYAPVGIVLSEAGIRLGYVNNKFSEITGIGRTGLLGTRWLDAIHPEDLPALLGSLDEVMGGAHIETTVRIVSPSDAPRWAQLRLSPITTPRRAAGFIGTIEDITARRAWETQLAYQAGHDALTGLANRRSLMETLTSLLTSRRSRDHKLAVLFCDLDGFKEINDTLGHDAGDRVLIEVGQRLSATARDHDMVARIAGDEFVIIVREIHDLADAEAAAARQLSALIPSIHVGGRAVRVSASIGLAMAEDFDDATSLLRAADRGMYEAKGAGRGIYRAAPTPVAGLEHADSDLDPDRFGTSVLRGDGPGAAVPPVRLATTSAFDTAFDTFDDVFDRYSETTGTGTESGPRS